MDKKDIRPIYSEIQGYLLQVKDTGILFEDESTLWNQYNQSVQELNKITGKDYNKFLLKPENRDWNGSIRICIRTSVYRSTVSGLISRLYGEYFSDEVNPLSGTPSTIINQTQQQNQSVEMLFELRDEIDKKISVAPEGSKERTFLEKVKDGLSSVKNYSQLIALIVRIGTELGLTIQEIMKLFGK